jgi:hypothetical protein
MCSHYVPFKSTKVSKKSLLPASGNRENERKCLSKCYYAFNEQSQKTNLSRNAKENLHHERIKRFLAQVHDCDSTADIITCSATITKRLKNYNKHLKCLPGSVVGKGARYDPDDPGDRISVEGENLRSRPYRC